MQQDRKVTDFLRHLVRGHGQCGDDAEPRVGHERGPRARRRARCGRHRRRGSAVATPHRAPRGSANAFRTVVVAMPPQDELLEQEERDDAEQQREAHGVRAAGPIWSSAWESGRGTPRRAAPVAKLTRCGSTAARLRSPRARNIEAASALTNPLRAVKTTISRACSRQVRSGPKGQPSTAVKRATPAWPCAR